jgi:hypothetical protein
MSTTTVENDLQERLHLAGTEFERVHRQLNTKRQEFTAIKLSCSPSEFSAMSSAISQLELVEQERKMEFSVLESEFANQLYAEREEFARKDLLRQRGILEAELDAGQKEIDTLQAQINLARDRIGHLVNQRNCRILAQLNLLPKE